MKKEKTSKIVMLAVLTLITSVVWIFFAVYRTLTKKEEPKTQADIISPLNPSLDSKIINQIETRVFVDENSIPETQIKSTEKTPSPTPQPEETPAEETGSTEENTENETENANQ